MLKVLLTLGALFFIYKVYKRIDLIKHEYSFKDKVLFFADNWLITKSEAEQHQKFRKRQLEAINEQIAKKEKIQKHLKNPVSTDSLASIPGFYPTSYWSERDHRVDGIIESLFDKIERDLEKMNRKVNTRILAITALAAVFMIFINLITGS